MLKFKAYQMCLILVIASGLFLAFLAMWVGGDEYFASAPVLPCFIGVIVLLIKEIRANRTFATRYNPYCANSGLPKTVIFADALQWRGVYPQCRKRRLPPFACDQHFGRLSRKGLRCVIRWRWLVTFALTSRAMRSATFLSHSAWKGSTAMTRSTM